MKIGGTIELSFDDSKVKIIVIEPEIGGTASASMSAGPAPSNPPPKIRVHEENKVLNIQ
ncbi:MAG: hypothetical protein NY202_01635 [Mollicutes bacterium UO1]